MIIIMIIIIITKISEKLKKPFLSATLFQLKLTLKKYLKFRLNRSNKHSNKTHTYRLKPVC